MKCGAAGKQPRRVEIRQAEVGYLQPIRRMADDSVDSVELDTDMTGVVHIIGDVVEPMHSNGELQPRDRKQRCPGGCLSQS